MNSQIFLRIVVVNPPLGVTFALQQGRSDLVGPVKTTPTSIIFQFPVSVADASTDPPRLTGKFAQGTPAARFVYVNSGSMAGQANTCWTRRAKVPLTNISKALVQWALATDDQILETRISGKSRDGGPACATVPLLSDWAPADKSSPAA